MTITYGETDSEKMANESRIAHQIVKEIGDFGINERQRWLIIYNLAMELENVEDMKAITSFLKEVKGNEMFISRIYGGEEE